MNLGCLDMAFIDETVAEIKEYVDLCKRKNKSFILDVIIKTLQELKEGSHNHG